MNETLLDLATNLTILYPDIASSFQIMAAAGINTGRILTEQQPTTRWFYAVREAEKANLVSVLLKTALDEYPAHAGLQAIQAELDKMGEFNQVPLLIAAIGSDALLSLDLASLRAVRTATDMDFFRIQDATLEKLKTALDRERAQGRRCNVHMAVHSSMEGILLGGQLVSAVTLSALLDGVLVLLIAGCNSDQVGDFLGVVPHVVSFSEEVEHTDAALFTKLFWMAIGSKLSPQTSLRFALDRSPSGIREFVVKSW